MELGLIVQRFVIVVDVWRKKGWSQRGWDERGGAAVR
jgi:hypothetical protein